VCQWLQVEVALLLLDGGLHVLREPNYADAILGKLRIPGVAAAPIVGTDEAHAADVGPAGAKGARTARVSDGEAFAGAGRGEVGAPGAGVVMTSGAGLGANLAAADVLDPTPQNRTADFAIVWPHTSHRAVVELKVEYSPTFSSVGDPGRFRVDHSVKKRFQGDCEKLSRWPKRGVEGEWWRWCVIVTISHEAAARINPYDGSLPEALRRHAYARGMKPSAVDDVRIQPLAGPHSASACYTRLVAASASAPALPEWAAIRIHVCEVSPTLAVPLWALDKVVLSTLTSPNSFAFGTKRLEKRQLEASVAAGIAAFEQERNAEATEMLAKSAAAADVGDKRMRTAKDMRTGRKGKSSPPVVELPQFASLETWLGAVIGQRAERALVLSGAPRAVNI